MSLRWPVVICIVQVIFAIFNYGKLYSQILVANFPKKYEGNVIIMLDWVVCLLERGGQKKTCGQKKT